LLVDLDILERNIVKMAEFCKAKRCGLRPHVKAHKNPLIAKKQLDAGAIGVCCQTLEEMEAMVMSGIGPVLLTHMLASRNSVERFLNLSRERKAMVTVDGIENTELLAKAAAHRGMTVDILVEVNVGQNRTGAEPGEPTADLASLVSRTKGLKFRGLMGYEGHLQGSVPEFEKRKKEDFSSLDGLGRTIDAVKKRGLDVEIVSSGGTGTYNIACEYPGVTEIQPGSYVTMDHRYNLIETTGKDFGNSLSVLSTVVSTPNERQAVVDMGWKGCGVEYQIFGWQGMPKPVLDGVTYSLGGDEHGILKSEDPSKRPKFGDKIRFIPSHCDTTLNLYGKFYGMRGNEVEVVCPVARR
jgi:D-serine deaminase-like pyridoxal phosphate-dependent protein